MKLNKLSYVVAMTVFVFTSTYVFANRRNQKADLYLDNCGDDKKGCMVDQECSFQVIPGGKFIEGECKFRRGTEKHPESICLCSK